MKQKRIIVCGGRDFEDVDRVRSVLALLRPDILLIHGDARGADRCAARVWEASFDGRTEAHPADWRGQGKAAGAIRNRQMLNIGVDAVIAFPGGTGTANMVSIARHAGVPVVFG